MDPDTNNPAEDKQTAAQNNTNDSHTIKGNNNKPKQTRAREKSATRYNRKTIEKAFPFKYIEHGMNGTKALQALRPHIKATTARAEAPLILAKPSVQAALQELLNENKLSLGETMKIHRRNMIQDEDLSTSQRAVQDVYKISGLMNNNDKGQTINIAMVIKPNDTAI